MLRCTRRIFRVLEESSPRLKRRFSIAPTERTFEEIQIPTPWGHVAGKWWGPQNRRPILALHGWQDNCGSFDRLMPYLPSHIGCLAVDDPGHGLSSHLPKGIFYHGIDNIHLYRRIIKYFNWQKVSFLGHSMGAMHSFMYTMIYPENVEFMICLDGLFYLLQSHSRPDVMSKTIDDFLRYDLLNSNSESPCYTFSQLEQLLHQGSRKSISVECTKYILQRNTVRVKENTEMFRLTRDLRLKGPSLLHWSIEQILESSKRITCPLLFSLGTNSFLIQMNFKKDAELILNKIKQNNNNVFEYEIEGTHHLHLNTPERIGGIVNEFILKFYTD